MPITTTPTPAEVDLPPGAAPYSAGPLATMRPPSAAAFRASGQTDVNRFLQPAPAAPAPSILTQAQGWMERARAGMASMFGQPAQPSVAMQMIPQRPQITAPPAAPATLQPVVAAPPPSPVYNQRLKAYNK